MRGTRPSFTARRVAQIRAELVRPEVITGDAAAELRLYRSLGRPRQGRVGRTLRERSKRRTAFFDRQTLDAIGRGVRQVVIVGAGYDGRALRFATPEVRFFEVDHPATQNDKRARLTALEATLGDTVFVPVDLTVDDVASALHAVGHDAARPSLFLVEGLLGYLPRAATSLLLTRLRHLPARPEGGLGARATAMAAARSDPLRRRGTTAHEVRPRRGRARPDGHGVEGLRRARAGR
jgi:methyltransferase (TIGR00027 family)